MGQHTSEFHQEQLSIVNKQVLDRLPSTAAEDVPASTDFGGFEPYVDEGVIARFVQITPRRVLEMARAGEIPSHPLGRGARKTWRFRISEVDAHFSTQHASTRGANLTAAVPGATRRKQ